MDWAQIIGLVVGTGGVTTALETIVIKVMDRKSITRQTLAMLTYSTLSDKVEKLLSQNYATPEQRKEVEQLYQLYKAHGWNGDMEARMDKIHALPTKRLGKRRA